MYIVVNKWIAYFYLKFYYLVHQDDALHQDRQDNIADFLSVICIIQYTLQKRIIRQMSSMRENVQSQQNYSFLF